MPLTLYSDYIIPQPPKLVEIKTEKPKIIHAKVTAYTHTGNLTSTGVMPTRGGCAVDPSRIPYQTRFYIDGYGNAVANDTGGDMRSYSGTHIDIFMETKEECVNWGVQYLDIVVK